MKLADILAKLGGTKNAAGETVAPTAETLTALATSLQTREGELTTLATALTTKEGELTTLATTLATKETALATKEADLTAKETKLATDTTNLETLVAEKAQKLSVQGTTPVKPENKTPDILAAYQAEKDPGKRFQIFQKNKEAIRAAAL